MQILLFKDNNGQGGPIKFALTLPLKVATILNLRLLMTSNDIKSFSSD